MGKANQLSFAKREPFALACVLSLALQLSTAVAFGLLNRATAFPQTNSPTVEKVEPPSWWTQHTINPVRLLIRGSNLRGAHIQTNVAGLLFSNVKVNSAGTYAFVDLRIDRSVPPGRYPFTIITPAGRAAASFEILAPLSATDHFQGIDQNDVIYLIMIDRFADGDSTNNAPSDAPVAASDRRNPRAFHGGDLRGVIDHLPYLKELGVTAIWLTPWQDNWDGLNNCDKPWCPNTYYHGYHAVDYYAVENRFGDLRTLRELVEKAHAAGLKVIQDQVANHVGSQHPWVRNSPMPDWFHGTLGEHQLNHFQNSSLLSPHANPNDVRNTLDGWFSDDLPDMNQDNPEVSRYEIQNALWWIGTTGIDGIREDTIQYMPRKFTRALSLALHRQYPKMWMVGEVFERDAAQTAFFIGGHRGWDGVDTNLDSVFDFALWNTSLKVFTGKLPMRSLQEQLKYDALYPDPLKITLLANNHDTPRFMSLDGATLAGAMLHTAFVLSLRGIPQLYYGEEIAMEGKDDPDNRRDFPGGFPGDERNAFTAPGRKPKEQKMFEWTQAWLQLRRQHSALRTGGLVDLYADDHVYVFARQNADETIVVALNRDSKERKVKLSLASIGIADGRLMEAATGIATTNRVERGEVNLSLSPETAAAYTFKKSNLELR